MWDDRHGEEFFTCPIRFIGYDVVDWYQEYSYAKEFGCHAYHEQSSKWIEAWMTYQHYYNKYQGYKIEAKKEDSVRSRSDDALNTMASNYMRQKRG